MGSPSPSKVADRLARIRENQRKSRARKQAHTRELEQKLIFLQEQVRQKDVEHRLTVQCLDAENRRLRCLLLDVGLSSNAIEDYLNKTVDDPSPTQKIAIPSLSRSGVKARPCRGRVQQTCRSETTPDTAGVSPPLDSKPVNGVRESTVDLPGHPMKNDREKPHGQSVCGCSPDETGSSWPDSNSGDVLNTTLCAIADELITQYNTRGVELDEIRRKLWAGFSRGLTTEEGCRVQNQILFQVLDEISNN
ncbi:hypothetical protein ASPACDRAFT_40150 [Aspergillus aculeatus ATCC 16872]|uniref:BZIP domain-containing protein n=1 Tax=Aspergillus aculeatus (strain ATCC 16872 / CBS 172.66 / WB 5094) TaxID=690307 RepID=A0A1L9X2Y0_ASPA1|nr:uncharacterized protein ASPACDRAFT_40150 [Aspergillus aculeatus ATCC 16872]OJK02837.1 hypothetical protein ASPACDRAFT_40150 [Aspergillus aculeatus ATCC 16872]